MIFGIKKSKKSGLHSQEIEIGSIAWKTRNKDKCKTFFERSKGRWISETVFWIVNSSKNKKVSFFGRI